MEKPQGIGLIIPSANRLTEPQFNRYLPAGVSAYVTRLRMAGKFRKPLAELKPHCAWPASSANRWRN
jgi:maleate cis-trans isomerase